MKTEEDGCVEARGELSLREEQLKLVILIFMYQQIYHACANKSVPINPML